MVTFTVPPSATKLVEAIPSARWIGYAIERGWSIIEVPASAADRVERLGAKRYEEET